MIYLLHFERRYKKELTMATSRTCDRCGHILILAGRQNTHAKEVGVLVAEQMDFRTNSSPQFLVSVTSLNDLCKECLHQVIDGKPFVGTRAILKTD